LRLPPYLPGLSPAFWTLETGGVARDRDHNLIRNELDIMEMFGDTSGNALNTNEIAWNQNWKADVGVTEFPNGDPQAAHHDYGVLQVPGVTSFYIDGKKAGRWKCEPSGLDARLAGQGIDAHDSAWSPRLLARSQSERHEQSVAAVFMGSIAPRLSTDEDSVSREIRESVVGSTRPLY
jgi:beta-glucanase (GH16 family)